MLLSEAAGVAADLAARSIQIDGSPWHVTPLSAYLRCERCDIDYPPLEPRLFSFNSPLGACPQCEGFGNLIDMDMDLIVPEPSKSLREGAIAPWNTPAYSHELEELLALADDFGLPIDIPFRELSEEHLSLIREGVPERDFGGLRGFFRWLERRKYKMHLRVFLSRWRSYKTCTACQGQRLRPEALAVEIGGRNIGQVSQLEINEARRFFQNLDMDAWQREMAAMMLRQIDNRLGYLEAVGLGYLTLDRTLRTLSGGEAQRVALTSALGSSLVNMLYVLDEPSVGLHPRDVGRLIEAVVGLKDRHNTIVVVEHEEAMLRAADQLIEIGPAAGERGGEVVFQGTLRQMESAEQSLTGEYLSGRLGVSPAESRRPTTRGWIRLKGARGNNLKNISAEFPLAVLCLVTGVSGSGKSTLVQDTLYGALCRRKRKNGAQPYPYDDIYGDGQIDDVPRLMRAPTTTAPGILASMWMEDGARHVMVTATRKLTCSSSPTFT
jgi:excinuclease ABC subunit A